MKQWSLDRINNDIGHNSGNLLIACLECNLKRRRINCDNFNFTQNMKIIKTNNNENSENSKNSEKILLYKIDNFHYFHYQIFLFLIHLFH